MKKFTTLDEDLLSEGRQVELMFNEQYSNIEKKLEQIEKAIRNLKFAYKEDIRNWGYVYKLELINEKLDDILKRSEQYVEKQLITDPNSDIQ